MGMGLHIGMVVLVFWLHPRMHVRRCGGCGCWWWEREEIVNEISLATSIWWS